MVDLGIIAYRHPWVPAVGLVRYPTHQLADGPQDLTLVPSAIFTANGFDLEPEGVDQLARKGQGRVLSPVLSEKLFNFQVRGIFPINGK